MRLRRPTAALVGAALLALTGCSGEDTPADDGQAPEDVLASAKETFDATSGVSLTIASEGLPQGLTALSGAEGIGTDAPAFEGALTVVLGGQEFEVPVVAVDGAVFAQIPLVPGWSDVDPAEYGAPDPAQLMSPDAGFSSLLPATEDVEEGESVRGGANNEEVLTEYTGTVPGEVVSNVIPSASGEFDAIYTINADGELRTAELTGVFYPSTDPMTYSIGFDDYGTEQDITAP